MALLRGVYLYYCLCLGKYIITSVCVQEGFILIVRNAPFVKKKFISITGFVKGGLFLSLSLVRGLITFFVKVGFLLIAGDFPSVKGELISITGIVKKRLLALLSLPMEVYCYYLLV